MVVLCTPVVSGRLEEVYEEDLLGKVKVTVSRSFPNQEPLRWGDGSIIHEHMDHLHLEERCRHLCVYVSRIEPLLLNVRLGGYYRQYYIV